MNTGILLGAMAILVFFLIVYIFSTLTGNYRVMFHKPIDGRELIKIQNDRFRLSSPMKGVSFSTTFWIFVKDWNYKFMAEKEIFNKGGFKCFLEARSNDLVVEIPVFASKNSERIVFKNIPLQKWLNIGIVVDNRFVDLWINGKLYHSKHLYNLPLFLENKDLIVCGCRGFDGFVSSFYYWDRPIGKLILRRIFNSGPKDNSLIGVLVRLFNNFRHIIKLKIGINLPENKIKRNIADTCGK